MNLSRRFISTLTPPSRREEEKEPQDLIHGLLRRLDSSTDSRPIQCVDEKNPESCAYQHHAEDKEKHDAH